MLNLDDQIKSIAHRMGKLGAGLISREENEPGTYGPLNEVSTFWTSPPRTSPKNHLKRLEQVMLEQDKHAERIKNGLAENERRLSTLAESVGNLEQQAQDVLSKLDETYRQTIDALEDKKQQVDTILGHVSGRAIAGDYEKRVASEKN